VKLKPRQVLKGGLNIIGADIVEVSPPFDSSGNTALIAATIMCEILCIIADAKYS
jgi:arginase family enzyme